MFFSSQYNYEQNTGCHSRHALECLNQSRNTDDHRCADGDPVDISSAIVHCVPRSWVEWSSTMTRNERYSYDSANLTDIRCSTGTSRSDENRWLRSVCSSLTTAWNCNHCYSCCNAGRFSHLKANGGRVRDNCWELRTFWIDLFGGLERIEAAVKIEVLNRFLSETIE